MFSRWRFAIYSGLSVISLSRALSLPAVAGEPFRSYAASTANHTSCDRWHLVPSLVTIRRRECGTAKISGPIQEDLDHSSTSEFGMATLNANETRARLAGANLRFRQLF